jgi:hypothetical protein
MIKLEQQLRESVSTMEFFSKQSSNLPGVFVSLGGTSSPSVLVEATISSPVLTIMHNSEPSTWIPLKSALEKLSSKLAAVESTLLAESEESLEKAACTACDRNEVETRVKKRKEIEETQKALESMLPSNGAAEVRVDNDGFYYIREDEQESSLRKIKTVTTSTASSSNSSLSHADPIDWERVMEKFNKFEEMEQEGLHEKSEEMEQEGLQEKSAEQIIEKKEARTISTHLPEKKKNEQFTSQTPFSGKIFERNGNGGVESSTVGMPRQRSLFSQREK